MSIPQQPVIKLSLSVEQLRKLIPEGSEIEASLTKGVVENYSRAIADRMVRKITEENETIIRRVCEQFNGLTPWYASTSIYNRSLLSDDYKLKITAWAEEQIKKQVEEVIRNVFSTELELQTKQRIEFKINTWLEQTINRSGKEMLKTLVIEELGNKTLKEFLNY